MPQDIKKQTLELNKLQKRLRRNVGNAIADYNMIEDGDKIMVCLSGGKDSYTMLEILQNLQRSAPIKFDLVAVNLDQKQPGFPEHILPEYLEKIGVPYHIIEEDTYSIVKSIIPEGKTTCGLCSRLRRGNLYTYAEENGYTKIALGHHRDDIIETVFLNMFHGGTLKAMPPKLKSDNGKHIVIRPMAYCTEDDIKTFSEIKEFPIIPCNLCGSQDHLQREIKIARQAALSACDTTFTKLEADLEEAKKVASTSKGSKEDGIDPSIDPIGWLKEQWHKPPNKKKGIERLKKKR